ncbi:MAG: hypothetical protein RPU64_04030 [Candidatus Sedimenticola sp. (ex Thyasira tokunagai)]
MIRAPITWGNCYVHDLKKPRQQPGGAAVCRGLHQEKERKRFSENCVQVVASHQEALTLADGDSDKYPANVVGPSHSSEGLRLFYLLEWFT